VAVFVLLLTLGPSASPDGRRAQTSTPFVPAGPAADAEAAPVLKELLSRLTLEQYKATIHGLAQFGDRREGTQRNRDALDWIEAELKSRGCTNTERHRYDLPPPNPGRGRSGQGGRGSTPDRVAGVTPDSPV
jgi:hypothetical protein